MERLDEYDWEKVENGKSCMKGKSSRGILGMVAS